MTTAGVADTPGGTPDELSPELRASLLGDYVRADRVAEVRGRLRRGEHPADAELASAIVADASG